MSGPRLVYPHFDHMNAEEMQELASGEGPWVHEHSAAHAHEQVGVPSDEIEPRDYIILRRDRPGRD